MFFNIVSDIASTKDKDDMPAPDLQAQKDLHDPVNEYPPPAPIFSPDPVKDPNICDTFIFIPNNIHQAAKIIHDNIKNRSPAAPDIFSTPMPTEPKKDKIKENLENMMQLMRRI